MASITSPRLNNTIRADVPAINAILKALAKADPSILSDIENGTKRFYEGTSGWEFQELVNGSWTTHTKFNIDAQSVDGFNTSVDAVASTIVVRGTDGKLKGNLTGKADTAGTADKLASTLAVNAGGTGATSAADARTNLGVPPTNHKSTTTNYGVSSATEYGHSMAGSDTPKADSGTGAVGSDVSHFARQDHVHPQLSATSSVKGDVKLSDATNSTSAASASIAATPKAVKAAYDLANTAKTTAESKQDALGFTPVQQGGGAGQANNKVYIGWSGTGLKVQVDSTDLGTLVRTVNGISADAAGNVALSAALPTGTVIAFAANATPAGGFLLCNGAAVSRTTYAALFSAIGTTYGTGDGSSTFNLPNLTNKFVMGSGTAGSVKNAGLPNITGSISNNRTGAFWNVSGSGALYTSEGDDAGAEYDKTVKYINIHINASRSSSIYGASSTVQPPALTMRFYIKY